MREYIDDNRISLSVIEKDHNINEIQEAIITIQSYLEQTKAALDRIETFIIQLKSESPFIEEKEKHFNVVDKDPVLKASPGLR